MAVESRVLRRRGLLEHARQQLADLLAHHGGAALDVGADVARRRVAVGVEDRVDDLEVLADVVAIRSGRVKSWMRRRSS